MLDKPHPDAAGQSSPARSAPGLAVLIVGMHRSGTSALGGLLNKLGVAVPEDLFPADQHNARGYFEPQSIIDFHEALLAKLGSPSNDPLPLTYDWVNGPLGQAAAAELADLLDQEFGGAAMCLFKDPRMCRLAPVWTAALALAGRPAVAVLPCRHPLEVAGSLLAKGGLSRPYALCMWLQHVLLGERFTRGLPRSFTFYDDLIDDWRALADKLQRELKVGWPRDVMRAGPDIDAFLSKEMRHHASRTEGLAPHDPLDALCARTWETLHRLNAAPDDAAAMATMDALWAEFEAAVGVFGPLLVTYQRDLDAARKDLHETLSYVGVADRRIVELDKAGHTLRGRLADRQRDLDWAHGALREKDAEIERRGAEIARREQDAAGQIAWRDRWAGELAAQIHVHEAEAERMRVDLAAHSAMVRQAWARAAALEASTSWKLATALRSPLANRPGLRHALRRGLELGWWTLTFKLGRKLAERPAAPVEEIAPSAPELFHPSEAQPVLVGDVDIAVADALAGDLDDEIECADGSDRAGDAAEQAPPQAGPARPPHVVFLSGEPTTPGHAYRIERYAEAAEAVGAAATVLRREEAKDHLDAIATADLLFIWRAHWNEHVEAAVAAARSGGAKVLFDVDDLLMEPDLARSEVIDGIRSQKFAEDSVRGHFELMERTFLEADYCSAPTEFLAHRLRRRGHPAFVLRNGFDETARSRARMAARARRRQPSDNLVRIGYATGSKTHQKDFGAAAEAIARILREHPEARLVAFRSQWGDVLDLAEFPAFDGLADRIEWRDMVPIAQLPDEMARFDINVAPLEVGNIFCESKSELKFFEAALAGVPTVASPTGPFKAAVRDGETGLLATTAQEWYAALKRLMLDPALRAAMAKAGELDALAEYGPERRAEAMASVLEQTLHQGRRAARAFELEVERAARPRPPRPHVPPHEIVFEADHLRASEATVVVPLYNYAHFVEEALESVAAQTVEGLDLVVVDDGSTDGSLAVARRWVESVQDRFNRVVLVRHLRNAGLAFARNTAFFHADTPFVLPLDADNRLAPGCVERLVAEARATGAAFVYPQLRYFGDTEALVRGADYDPARLVVANYIDAMALVRRSAWAAAGGYDHVRFGWEDYDFWCRLAERGMFGRRLAEPLAEYRVHGASMLRSETDLARNKLALIEDIEHRHPWLHIDRDPPA